MYIFKSTILILLLLVSPVSAGTTSFGDMLIGKEPGIKRYTAYTDDLVYLYLNITNSIGIEPNDIAHEWLGIRLLNHTTMVERPGASWSFITPDGRVQEFSKLGNFNDIYQYPYSFNHNSDTHLLFIGKYKTFRVFESFNSLGSILEYCYAFQNRDGEFIIENITSVWPYVCWGSQVCY